MEIRPVVCTESKEMCEMRWDIPSRLLCGNIPVAKLPVTTAVLQQTSKTSSAEDSEKETE